MAQFKDRTCVINVAGGTLPPDLTVKFEIEKSKKPEPNSCKLQIWNLSKATRDAIQALSLDLKQNKTGTGKGSFKQVGAQTGNIRVSIEAGYKEIGTPLLFRGDLRNASSERSGPNIITTIFGEDGGYSQLTARVSASFDEGTPMEVVARYCAARMGVGVGNLPAVFNGGLPGMNSPAFLVYTEGKVLYGSAGDELRKLLTAIDVTFSIQDGVIQCVYKGGYIPTEVVVLSSATGLVGSPVRDMSGYVRATALIQPGLFVGGRVRFDALDLKGDYKIHTVKYEGELKGKSWYAELECK